MLLSIVSTLQGWVKEGVERVEDRELCSVTTLVVLRAKLSNSLPMGLCGVWRNAGALPIWRSACRFSQTQMKSKHGYRQTDVMRLWIPKHCQKNIHTAHNHISLIWYEGENRDGCGQCFDQFQAINGMFFEAVTAICQWVLVDAGIIDGIDREFPGSKRLMRADPIDCPHWHLHSLVCVLNIRLKGNSHPLLTLPIQYLRPQCDTSSFERVDKMALNNPNHSLTILTLNGVMLTRSCFSTHSCGIRRLRLGVGSM